MSTSPEPVTPAAEDSSKVVNPVYEASRKILLAAVGAVSLTQDALDEFVAKLIERGEIAEKDGKRLVKEISEKHKKTIRSAENEAHQHIYDVLRKMNIPTKKDIEELNEKVVELTRKIDDLKKG